MQVSLCWCSTPMVWLIISVQEALGAWEKNPRVNTAELNPKSETYLPSHSFLDQKTKKPKTQRATVDQIKTHLSSLQPLLSVMWHQILDRHVNGGLEPLCVLSALITYQTNKWSLGSPDNPATDIWPDPTSDLLFHSLGGWSSLSINFVSDISYNLLMRNK